MNDSSSLRCHRKLPTKGPQALPHTHEAQSRALHYSFYIEAPRLHQLRLGESLQNSPKVHVQVLTLRVLELGTEYVKAQPAKIRYRLLRLDIFRCRADPTLCLILIATGLTLS